MRMPNCAIPSSAIGARSRGASAAASRRARREQAQHADRVAQQRQRRRPRLIDDEARGDHRRTDLDAGGGAPRSPARGGSEPLLPGLAHELVAEARVALLVREAVAGGLVDPARAPSTLFVHRTIVR